MASHDSLDNYFINWSTSVSDIASSDWEEIFGKSVIKSQQFFLSMEKSCFSQISFNYLQIFQHGTIVAIVPCFCYEIDILVNTPLPSIWQTKEYSAVGKYF